MSPVALQEWLEIQAGRYPELDARYGLSGLAVLLSGSAGPGAMDPCVEEERKQLGARLWTAMAADWLDLNSRLNLAAASGIPVEDLDTRAFEISCALASLAAILPEHELNAHTSGFAGYYKRCLF